MKQGNYFLIPEGPVDMQQLWSTAIPLTIDRLPSWLTPECASIYRELARPKKLPQSSLERKVYFEELDDFMELGIVVEYDERECDEHRIFVRIPRTEDVWSIGIMFGTSPTDVQHMSGFFNPVLTRDNVSDVPASYVADPFMVRSNDTWYMFFEVMNWKTCKGEIGLATSSNAVDWNYQKIVLDEPFHLSYPYVFAEEGEYFMIPESFQAGGVRLYRANTFPTKWEYVTTLIEAPYLVDASIFRYLDKWWMTVDASSDSRNDTLLLYMSDQLTGPWREHPMSPIVRNDPRHARPAGRVLSFDGRLIRFAQNSVPNYGTDVRAFEITHLTTTEYRERLLHHAPILGPAKTGWNADGMHHIDAHRIDENAWIASVDGWYREHPPQD